MSTLCRGGTAIIFLGLLGSATSPAKAPDPRLLSLVPPDSQIVAGALARKETRNHSNFLFYTRANTLDIADFVSIVGVDATRRIDQMIFTALTRDGSNTNLEHRLLVSWDFDAKRIYTS